MSSIFKFGCLLLLVAALPRLAQAQTSAFDPVAVRKAVDDFMSREIQDLPGVASYDVGSIGANNNLRPCDAYSVGLLPGGKIWGRTGVSVRCVSGANWTLRVPVQVHVVADYLVSARPLSAGVVLTREDFVTQRGDLGELPAGALTDPEQAIGRVSRSALPAGRPLRADMLRQPTVIQQGQNVRVTSRGPGFEVANEGRALSNAAIGQVVQIRLGNGQVVSGVAEASGNVEIGR